METTTITVRATPDALVKIYDETRNEVVYLDNTNADGESAPVTLPATGGQFYIDVTIFDNPTLTVS